MSIFHHWIKQHRIDIVPDQDIDDAAELFSVRDKYVILTKRDACPDVVEEATQILITMVAQGKAPCVPALWHEEVSSKIWRGAARIVGRMRIPDKFLQAADEAGWPAWVVAQKCRTSLRLTEFRIWEWRLQQEMRQQAAASSSGAAPVIPMWLSLNGVDAEVL